MSTTPQTPTTWAEDFFGMPMGRSPIQAAEEACYQLTCIAETVKSDPVAVSKAAAAIADIDNLRAYLQHEWRA